MTTEPKMDVDCFFVLIYYDRTDINCRKISASESRNLLFIFLVPLLGTQTTVLHLMLLAVLVR